MIAPLAYGALSATSTNTIQGRAPTFKGQSGAKKLGFKVNGAEYSESKGNLSPTDDNIFEPSLTPSHFHINTSLNFTVISDYQDVDGDDASLSDPFTMGAIRYVWKDSSNRELTADDMSKMIGCGSGLRLPLTLTITLPNVQVHSEYGHPRDSDETTLEQNYKITTLSGICYAKPNSLDTYGSTIDPIKGGGYTADFVPNKGFKANPTIASLKFPTTGFPGAEFKLMMNGNANDYEFSSHDSSASVGNVSSNAGTVTLTSKPTRSITISARLKATPSIVHYYTFDPRGVWIEPQFNAIGYDSAERNCGDKKGLPTRKQLTSSPQNVAIAGASIPTNYFTREISKYDASGQIISGGVFSEWGKTRQSVYPGLDVNGYRYYTRDEYSTTMQFAVNASSGGVLSIMKNGGYSAACLN
ncbi:hypothetical protein RCS94_10375 [Orbaceae bacterium ac157xtp]